MVHKHPIYDTDPHFKIDGDTRVITNVSDVKVALMQGDHNSERFTFEIPRYVDGHDMSLCNICQIHYLNIGSSNRATNTGIYEVEDLQFDPKDEQNRVVLSWLISSNVTMYVGSLSFVIRFGCSTDGVVDYIWNTAVHSGITISSSICNSETVVQDYTDILEQWRDKLFSTYEAVVSVDLKTASWVESPDMTYYTQVITIPNITATTKIDLQPTPEQLISMITAGIVMFIANDNGNVKVYSVNDKPATDMTIQATIKETSL